MPLIQYRLIRTQLLRADTIKIECDSLSTISEKRIQLKDSTLAMQYYKIVYKDSIIFEKDKTINLLSKVPQEKNKFALPALSGGIIGLILGILLMK